MSMVFPSSRPSPKQQRVLSHLRQEILGGVLSPGARLPTRSRLERRFRASSITVQRVFDKLARDGYIESRGRGGTFVTPNPPHLSHFGLVFMHRPSHAYPWSLFYKALESEARSQGESMTTYYHGLGPESPDYRTLEADVISHRVGGLIFVFPPVDIAGTPVVTHPGVPRVCVSRGEHVGMPGVGPDTWSFFARAAEHLIAQGRRRIAIITPDPSADIHQQLIEMIARAGAETRPYWLQVVNPQTTIAARQSAHLLARLSGNDRPDAMIVADDNLLDETMAGLVASGIRIPDELAIVSHWNFPNDPPRVLPVTYLGFDCRDLIHRCLEVVELLRRGGSAPAATPVSAMFEDEWNQSRQASARQIEFRQS